MSQSNIPEKIIKYANQCNPSQQDVDRFLKAWKLPNSKSAAIKAVCTDCMGFEDVRRRVRECAADTCPLHHHRPFRVDNLDDEND